MHIQQLLIHKKMNTDILVWWPFQNIDIKLVQKI